MPFLLGSIHGYRALPPGFLTDLCLHCHAESTPEDNLFKAVSTAAANSPEEGQPHLMTLIN